MARSIIVYVSGIDGAGKTATATTLEQQLRKLGLPVIRIWFRFPYFTLYPLLFIAHKIGMTKTFRYNNKTFTVHFFERIARPYILLFVFDFTLHLIARVLVRTLLPLIIIVERGPIDTLVDLLSDVNAQHSRLCSTVRRYFINLQKRGITIFTTADLRTIIKRRPESIIDPKFLYRYKLYNLLLKKHLSSTIIINTSKPQQVNTMRLKAISTYIVKIYGYKGYGKLFENPYLKAFFANRWIILASNWLVQGSLIADPTENIIRIIVDTTLPLIVLHLTSNTTYTILSLIAAHTLNYLFNSNSTHVIRFFRKVNPEKNLNAVINFLSKQNIDHLYAVVIFGSIVRREQKSSSDIDIRIIRENHIKRAIKSYILLAKLRFFALRHGIPLDIFMHTIDKLCKIVNPNEINKMYIIPPTRKKDIINACLKYIE